FMPTGGMQFGGGVQVPAPQEPAVLTNPITLGGAHHLQGVDPRLAQVVQRAQEIAGVPLMVTDGARTVEEQRDNMARGVSWTMNSMHLPGEAGVARAIDVVPVVNGQPSWDASLFGPVQAAMQKAAEELGVDLEWGGNWTQRDLAHWQLAGSPNHRGPPPPANVLAPTPEIVPTAGPATTTPEPRRGLLGEIQTGGMNKGLLALAASLLDASGPSPVPVSLGQAIGRGLLAMQALDEDKFETLSPGEVAALGLPEGTVVQRAPNGELSVPGGRPRQQSGGGLPTSYEEYMLAQQDPAFAAYQEAQRGGDGTDNPTSYEEYIRTLPAGQAPTPEGYQEWLAARSRATTNPEAEIFDRANTLRDEFLTRTEKFVKSQNSFNAMMNLARDATGASDIALGRTFFLTLEPDSVVREAEFAQTGQILGLEDRIITLLQRLDDGQMFTPAQRQSLVDAAGRFMAEQQADYDALERQYTEIAGRHGVNPQDVIVDRSREIGVRTAINPQGVTIYDRGNGYWEYADGTRYNG
ncbi:MAG TPA: M15 family metallopeptidase, partial [Acetobacteraceae bacterium]|nr:M15 family metallopeptidase [Acetobacteraceae bacterium]